MHRREFLCLATAAMAGGGVIKSLRAGEDQPENLPRHLVAFSQKGLYAGWPANNGIWMWKGREILVGFALGGYKEQAGHNITGPIRCVLARSLDGGETWTMEDPKGFVGDGGDRRALDKPTDFTQDGFAMRVVGTGYHGSDDPKGSFFLSTDRGRSWNGPWTFGSLGQSPELEGMELTPRTDYVVEGKRQCLVFLSARKSPMADRLFCARTTDGGLNWQFVAWVVPPADPHRAVMSQTVRCGAGKLLSAVRRRAFPKDKCWIDAYVSGDDGRTWKHASRVGETGGSNGNPPALIRLKDGRCCVAYGNRDRKVMLCRLSNDDGATWGDEIVLRSPDARNNGDFGYPRMVQRDDGAVLLCYYWADARHPHHHIAATIWRPPEPTK